MATSKPRRRANLTSCHERSASPRALSVSDGAAVVSDRVVPDPEAIAELERLREVTRGDLDLMALLPQTPDDRRQDQYVGRVGEVDPDLHDANAATTSSACARVNTGLIGSARFVRASSSVTGSSSALPLRPTYGAIAGWRCSGTR